MNLIHMTPLLWIMDLVLLEEILLQIHGPLINTKALLMTLFNLILEFITESKRNQTG